VMAPALTLPSDGSNGALRRPRTRLEAWCAR